jgi:uncharacterized protein (TIGR02453 family)
MTGQIEIPGQLIGRPMTFTGWPAEALEFYEGLAADNTKSYWTAHKASYERDVHAPMVALLGELEPEFGEGRIFRPYRDVRFSADKSPYKTAIAATLACGGYIQLTAVGLAAGSGMHQMAPDQLERYRRAVADDLSGEELRKVIAGIDQHDIAVNGYESLKTAPRGYPRDHPRADLLRHKGLVAWQEWPGAAWLGTAAAKDRVTGFLRATRPLCEWLDARVGDTEMAR